MKLNIYLQLCLQLYLLCVCAANFGPVDCLSTRLFLDGPKIAEEFEVTYFLPRSVCAFASLLDPLLLHRVLQRQPFRRGENSLIIK